MISNFRLVEKRECNETAEFWFQAMITIETGYFFKEKKDYLVSSSTTRNWRFVETGKLVSGDEIYLLVMGYEGRHMRALDQFPNTRIAGRVPEYSVKQKENK